MKRIIKLGEGKYIHLDSYGETTKESTVGNLIVIVMVIGIATLTVGAMLGINFTEKAPQITPSTKMGPGY